LQAKYNAKINETDEASIFNITLCVPISSRKQNKCGYYTGGIFNITVAYDYRYPFREPVLTIISPIYHPHIARLNIKSVDLDGVIGDWSPQLKTEDILDCFFNFSDVDLMCCENVNAATAFLYNEPEFEFNVRALIRRTNCQLQTTINI